MTSFDLRQVKLRPGEEHREALEVELPAFEFGGQRYLPVPEQRPGRARRHAARSPAPSSRSRSTARLHGPCYRCLGDAVLDVPIRAREYQASSPDDDELTTPYLVDEQLEVSDWARDAVALALPDKILCRPDCAGLCAVCGKNLNDEPHEHEEKPVDPRWAALEALRERASDDASGLQCPPLMAVPKRKTSKSRRDKRRATHATRGAAGEHLPAVPLAEARRIASARPAAPTRAARSSRSASRRRSAWPASRSTRWAGTAPRTRSSPARSRRPRTGIEVTLYGPAGPRHGRARRSSRRREAIDMAEKPAEAVRAKPRLVARRAPCARSPTGDADAVVSAGNTGAMLAAGLLHLRRLPGVLRPAIAVPIPTRNGASLLIDAGANADSRPEHLLQFGDHGLDLRRGDPRRRAPGRAPALDRRGAREGQPARRSRRTRCSRDAPGIELRRQRRGAATSLRGAADVVVTDGFTGNMALKLLEGGDRELFDLLREEIAATTRGKLGGLLIRPAARRLRDAARPGHLRRRVPARPARPGRDRARQLGPARDRERDPARGPRRRAPGRRAARRAPAGTGRGRADAARAQGAERPVACV